MSFILSSIKATTSWSLAWVVLLQFVAAGPVAANPAGGVVMAGSASIGSTPGTTTITQSSKTAIINWQSFSINSGEVTKFIQPNSMSAVLNRVTGGQTSLIDGTLSANGQVYLINGNGIIVGKGGLINAARFTGSTRDIADGDFLAGNYHFSGSSSAGVANYGTIKALGGDVILIGKTIDNEGAIEAANGTVGLAAADDVLIAQKGNQHVFVRPSTTASSAAGQTGVKNGGSIAAAGAELRAANGNIYALAINNAGTVRSTTVTHQGGGIYLTSDAGTVQNTGTLDASASAARGQGGRVAVIAGKNAGDLAVQAGSIISKGGLRGRGGDAEVSGAGIQLTGAVDLTAPSGVTGDFTIDPATLTVITGGTIASGSFTSTGTGVTNPADAGANDTIDPSVVAGLLASSNVTLNADSSITITNGITWTSANTLSLTLNNYLTTPQININAPISGVNGGLTITGRFVNNSGVFTPSSIVATADVNVGTFFLNRGLWLQIAGQNGVPATLPAFSVTNDFELGTSIVSTFKRFAGGDGGSSTPFQITDIYGLQGLASPSKFFYVHNGTSNIGGSYSFILDNNIDASVTRTWRSGNGFYPIGNTGVGGAIGGNFDGNHFAITNLYEAFDGNHLPTTPAPTSVADGNDNGSVGLFSLTNAGVISDLTLGVTLVVANDGAGTVGGLVAKNNGATISNVTVTGTINGSDFSAAGGLVGVNQAGAISGSSTDIAINVSVDTGASPVGGLVGDDEDSIQTSLATGDLTVTQTSVNGGGNANGIGIGGLVGFAGAQATISNSYATGAVTVNDFGNNSDGNAVIPVGGFIGDFEGASILNVYSVGVVTETTPQTTSNPNVGIFAGILGPGSVSEAFSRTDNQTTVGTLVGMGDPTEITGVDNSAGVALTSATIPFIDGMTFFQATDASGPTDGFPTLSPPAGVMVDTTSLTLTDNILSGTSTFGDTVTLTATVSDLTNGSTSVGAGTVTFSENGDVIDGSVSTVANGIATFQVPTLNASSSEYDFTASYSGATNFATSSTASALALVVNQRTLTLMASSQTLNPGDTVNTTPTLGTTYTVTGLQGTDALGDVLATGPTLSTTQSTATSGTFPGAIVISGTLNGAEGSNYALTLNNGNLTVRTITPDTTALSLASSVGPTATYGDTITLTATLSDVTHTGTTVAGGTVSFDENGTLIGGSATAVTGGLATFQVPTLNASGTAYEFTAVYSGVTNLFTGATTTAPVPITVNQRALTLMASSQIVNPNAPINTTATLGQTYSASGLQGSDQLSGVLATGPTLSSTHSTATSGTFPGVIAVGATLNTGVGSNYTLTLVNGDLTVRSVIPDITAISLSSNTGTTTTYGRSLVLTATLSDTTTPGTTVTGGTVSFDENGVAIQSPVTVTGNSVSLTLTSLLNASSTAYDFTAIYSGGDAFAGSTTTAPLPITVNRQTLTLMAASQTVSFNGQVNTTPTLGTTYTVSGLQGTDQLGSVLATGPTLNTTQSTAASGTFPGAIAIGATLNGTAGNNYALALVNGALTVQPPPSDTTTISLSDNLGAAFTYGQGLTLTATLADITRPGTTIAGGTVTFDENGVAFQSPVAVTGNTVFLTLTSPLNASAAAYDFTANYSGGTGFAASTSLAPLALNVNPAALSIMAASATKVYGTAMPIYIGAAFTTTGLVSGTSDAVTGVTLASAGTATTATVNGGTPYPIAASAAQGSGLSNYNITYVSGGLTVTPAPLTVTLGAATKTYGSTALSFAGPIFTPAGLVNGDTVTGVTLSSPGQAATAGVNGGTAYALSASATQGTGLDNYAITYNAGTVTVTPAQLTLAAASQTIMTGGTINSMPILNTTYTISGLQNTDTGSGVLSASPTLSTAQNTALVGVFPDAISISGVLNTGLGSNYSLGVASGTLTVETAPPSASPSQFFQLAQQEEFNQVGVTDQNANFDGLFGQSNLVPADDSGNQLIIASNSGEPLRRYYTAPPAASGPNETFAGMQVLAHASSFTVGPR